MTEARETDAILLQVGWTVDLGNGPEVIEKMIRPGAYHDAVLTRDIVTDKDVHIDVSVGRKVLVLDTGKRKRS